MNPVTRRTPRVYCGAPARIEGPRGAIRGTIRNLSRGGSFFLGETLPVGQSIELVIQLPSTPPIRAIGEIRYHHRYEEGEGMGIRFVRLTGEGLDSITRFVAIRTGNA